MNAVNLISDANILNIFCGGFTTSWTYSTMASWYTTTTQDSVGLGVSRLMYCSDALQKAVTALYANLLVILGFSLPLAEVMSVHIEEGR